MEEAGRWLRVVTGAGLLLYVTGAIGATLVEILAHGYLGQGLVHLSLLQARRFLNASIILLVLAVPAALGAIRLAALPGRSRADGDGGRFRRALQAALALLVLLAIGATALFREFFPAINAAVRTSPLVDAIQGSLGSLGDFLGTRTEKVLILGSVALAGSMALVILSIGVLGRGAGARALERRLTRKRPLRGGTSIVIAGLLLPVAAVNLFAEILRPVPATGSPNILLISVETLRADHLEAWGYERTTAPALARLARRGVLFANAIAQAPWTLPSMASVHTGLYLSGHGASGHKSKLGAGLVTVAERLAEEGYRTMAVVTWPFLTRTHGFDQGFVEFDQARIAADGSEVLAPEVTRRALELVGSARGDPFFLWLHYVEPHGAYVDHESVDHASGYAGPLPRVVNLERLYEVRSRLDDDDVRYVRDLYDEEITIVDRSLDVLLRDLRQRGLADGTVVIVLGDHGEEFLERGHFGHARHLYQELIHVPLVVLDPRDPGLAALRVEAPVELRSVAPTILALAGIEGGIESPGSPRGSSLLEVARGAVSPGPAFSEYVDQWGIYGERKAVVAGPYKMIRDAGGGAEELYDLTADPGERRNMIGASGELAGDPAPGAVPQAAGQGREIRDVAARMARALDTMAAGPARPGDEAILTEEEIERLRTLGYVR